MRVFLQQTNKKTKQKQPKKQSIENKKTTAAKTKQKAQIFILCWTESLLNVLSVAVYTDDFLRSSLLN